MRLINNAVGWGVSTPNIDLNDAAFNTLPPEQQDYWVKYNIDYAFQQGLDGDHDILRGILSYLRNHNVVLVLEGVNFSHQDIADYDYDFSNFHSVEVPIMTEGLLVTDNTFHSAPGWFQHTWLDHNKALALESLRGSDGAVFWNIYVSRAAQVDLRGEKSLGGVAIPVETELSNVLVDDTTDLRRTVVPPEVLEEASEVFKRELARQNSESRQKSDGNEPHGSAQ